MKVNKNNIKFSIILIITLLSTIPICSKNQSNGVQNVSAWNKCKAFINNFAQFLKKNLDYIAVAAIPTIVILKCFFGVTLESRRASARSLINSYKNSNIFWQLFAMLGCDFRRLNKAHLVERLSNEQLKKFITIEKLDAFLVGMVCFIYYRLCKNLQYPGKHLDVEGKVAIVGEPIIISEELGNSNTQSS